VRVGRLATDRQAEHRGVEHPGAERWLAIHDELLRGIAHALSNRVATMSVVTFMLDAPGADVGRQADALRGETEQIEALLMAMRALPRGIDGGAEPMIAGDAVRGALALHAHHGELRDVPCEVVTEGDVPPVLADPQALLHAVVAALTAARRHAASRGTGARLTVRGTADRVQLVAGIDGETLEPIDAGAPGGDAGIDATIDAATEADAAAARWLLQEDGGHAIARPAGLLLELPTLQAARRRA
jgi:hypothetical protein